MIPVALLGAQQYRDEVAFAADIRDRVDLAALQSGTPVGVGAYCVMGVPRERGKL